MGDIFSYIFLAAVMLSAAIAILSIFFGIISVLAYKHYKYVNKMSDKAALEWMKATRPPARKLL